MQKQKTYNFPALILTMSIVFLLGILFGVVSYYSKIKDTNNTQREIRQMQIKSIELSKDKKTILNAETKEAIFTIDEVEKFINEYLEYGLGYAKERSSEFSGSCFGDIKLSNSKNRIVFSTDCIEGDSQEAWVGVYNFQLVPYDCASDSLCKTNPNPPKFQFIIGGNGKDFIWSEEDEKITYEVNLGLLEINETRKINSKTGEIIEKELESRKDTSSWLTYNALASAEGYYANYKIKYSRNWLYQENLLFMPKKPLHNVVFDREDQRWRLNYNIKVFSKVDKESLFTSADYSFMDVKIGDNYFQEAISKKYNIKTYIYETGYSNNLSENYYIIFRLQEPDENNFEMMIASLNTLQFLTKENKGVVIGADEGSWKKVFISEKYGFQMKYQNGFTAIDDLDNYSLTFVDGMRMYSNIYLSIGLLSGVSSAEEWLDRELTINENASKKEDREYYRIGDSNVIGTMAYQKDNEGNIKNRIFYVSQGIYLYKITAPLAGVNEFAYSRMVANFQFLQPKDKLIGLKSKWGIDTIFEFDEKSGKLKKVINEKDFIEKGYKRDEIKWYETKIAGVVPGEIRNFFPITRINPQVSMDISNWKTYHGKNGVYEFRYPEEWELEDYSSSGILYFNNQRESDDYAIPRITIMIDRKPSLSETQRIIGSTSIVQFNNIEALATRMYGGKKTDIYSYLDSNNSIYLEFRVSGHDYFIKYNFEGGYNMQEFNTFLSSTNFK